MTVGFFMVRVSLQSIDHVVVHKSSLGKNGRLADYAENELEKGSMKYSPADGGNVSSEFKGP
jgi:hypothetical protein